MAEEPKSFPGLLELVKSIHGEGVEEKRTLKKIIKVEERKFFKGGEEIDFSEIDCYKCDKCNVYYQGKPKEEKERPKKKFFEMKGVFESIDENHLLHELLESHSRYRCWKCGEPVEYPLKPIKVVKKEW